MTKRILVALLALVLFFQSFALIISAATTLPFTYKEEGVYSASGKYYTRAVITSDYKELKTGDVFFLDSNGKVVLDSWLITQLYTVSVVGKDVAASAAVSAKSQRELAEIYREIFANIQAMDKMGEIIGSGSGLVLTVFTAQDPVNIGKAALSFAGDVVDIKTAITSSLLLIWSHNAVAYANRVEDSSISPSRITTHWWT